jgi:hypothetical protein
MASVDNPTPSEQSTDVTTAAGADAAIPLPPPAEPPPRTTPEALRQAVHRLDLLLALAVIAFGFVVASFRATNSDFLRHAATGRLLIEGHYSFGSEPFTWGAAPEPWVNTSWLYDLISYLLYQGSEAGGILVVVLKASSVAFMALLMLQVGRTAGRSLLLPACCVGLALLAFSPYALLQPSCVSAVFLAATLWLLRHPRRLREACPLGGATCTWSFWLLPPLFALWANLDSWYLLGPLTASLYLAGENFTARNPATAGNALRPAELRTLWIAVVVGIAACCLNPFGPRIFLVPPPELAAGPVEWCLSPFSPLYFEPSTGLSIAGAAYLALLLLGVLSFALQRLGSPGVGGLLGWRLLVWVAFAVLSAYRARCIGYFAVVAGPITALNLSDFFARRTAPNESVASLRRAAVVRGFALLVAIVAIVAAVPGWLQALPHAAHRVAWGVEIDPALRHAAETIHSYRERHLIPEDANCLTLIPDTSNYLAWFAPGQRGFLDDRLPLFADAIHRLPAVRRPFVSRDAYQAEDWRPYLRDNKVRFVVVSLPERSTMGGERQQAVRIIDSLFRVPGEWTVCELQDSAVVFGWKDPQQPAQVQEVDRLKANFAQRAFGADAVTAPESGANRPPQPRPWWSELWEAPLPIPPAETEAALHVIRFRAVKPAYEEDTVRQWRALLAACQVGQATATIPAAENSLVLLRVATTITARLEGTLDPEHVTPLDRYCLTREQEHYLRQDHGPPETLFLAVRRGRQAVAANPDDARAHLWLAQAYEQLLSDTREALLAGGVQEIGTIRRGQIIAEANRALRCDPSPAVARDAHDLLVRVYSALPTHRDTLVRHARARLEAMREAGGAPDEKPAEFAARIAASEKALEQVDKELKQLQDKHTIGTEGKRLLETARAALQFGLADKALNLLRNTTEIQDLMDPRTRTMAGRDLLVELLLHNGELEQLIDMLSLEGVRQDPDTQYQLLLYNLRRWAAEGDYAQARGGLDRLLAMTDEQIVRGKINSVQASMRSAMLSADLTRLHLLYAWVAVEEGAIADARHHLDAAAQTMKPLQQWLPLLANEGLTQVEAVQINQLLARDSANRSLAYCLRDWLARAGRNVN